MLRTWGDDIFGGFSQRSEEDISRDRMDRIRNQINEVIDRENVTYDEVMKVINERLT